MRQFDITTVRSAALFVSALQRSDDPGTAQVRQAVAGAVREFGSRGCAALVAQEFGDHPDIAVARMRWARRTVDEVFGAGHVGSGRRPGGWSAAERPTGCRPAA